MRAPTRDIALLVGYYVWEMTDKLAVLGYTIVGFNFGQGGTLQASSGEDELDVGAVQASGRLVLNPLISSKQAEKLHPVVKSKLTCLLAAERYDELVRPFWLEAAAGYEALENSIRSFIPSANGCTGPQSDDNSCTMPLPGQHDR
jgi:hypothetical protein